MNDAFERIQQIVENARHAGRSTLLETEGNEILSLAGFNVPAYISVRGADEISSADSTRFAGDRVVVKATSPDIPHKTEAGAVAVVANNLTAIRRTVEEMNVRLSGRSIAGFTVHEFVEYDRELGGEMLLGFRWTEDFGPVVVFGPGGIYAETLPEFFKPGRDIALLSASIPPAGGIGGVLSRTAVARIVSVGHRGRPPRVALDHLVEACDKMTVLASHCSPALFSEFEVNPLVVAGDGLYALDVLAKLADGVLPAPPPRPLPKIKALLEPGTIAVVGVSEKKQNPGRAILTNTIREGFDTQSIYVVKPGVDSIDGCRCVPDIASLPGRVDLVVLAIAAAQVPRTVSEIIDGKKAESVIVIPGGLEEKSGHDEVIAGLYADIERSRGTSWRGPVINGGNSLGIRSRPGRYDTIFIPQYKLGGGDGDPRVAFLSQSGAFAIVQGSKLSSIGMRYTISIGNQMDLTVGDYLEFLEGDSEIDIFAVYLEGFKRLDGTRFLEAAQRITDGGRTVVLYSGGRSEAGAGAAASHTASVAGNYEITRQLAIGAGIVVADTLEDFEDLIMLFDTLRGRRVGGLRLGALSNAGFECVALADNIGEFRFDPFAEDTAGSIKGVFQRTAIESIVDVHNPLDVTPMMDDENFEAIIRAVLDDENVDVGVVGCVPFTGQLNTLPPGEGHSENLFSHNSIAQRLIRLHAEIQKPWVVVVDGGPLYFEMRRLLHRHGVPTFRTADRALRLFSIYCNVQRQRPPAA